MKIDSEGCARRLGLVMPVLLWAGSIAALLQALRADEVAGLLARQHGRVDVLGRVGHLHGLAVMWSFVLAALQIAAVLVGAAVLRQWYRLRPATSFALSGVLVIVLNAFWLFGLLVWMRVYGETR